MLLGKMYKYEMDPTRTLGATERTRNAGRTEWNQYTPQQIPSIMITKASDASVLLGHNEFNTILGLQKNNVNIGSGNGLMLSGNKPLSYHRKCLFCHLPDSTFTSAHKLNL